MVMYFDSKKQEANGKVLAHQQEQAQIAIDKAILSVERKYQEQVQALKEKHQVEVDRYQQRYNAQ